MSDFNLHPPFGSRKHKKRVGRGSSSGHGTTSGRGTKGQQSRSGGRTYVGFEGGQMPLYRRIAQRGFSNYPFKVEYEVFNLSQLVEKFEAGATVSRETLLAKGLLNKKNALVKILGDGELDGKTLNVEVDKVSKSAKEKLEAAGGVVKLVK